MMGEKVLKGIYIDDVKERYSNLAIFVHGSHKMAVTSDNPISIVTE